MPDATDPIKHRLEFELFYHLGENRTASKLARLQMPRLYPETPRDSPEWDTKFNSLYVKYRRWENNENWSEIAQKRDDDKRVEGAVLMQKEEETLSETVRMYRRMVRYMLQRFANAVAENKMTIKTPDEAKRMVELDMYLTRVLEARPKLLQSAVYSLMDEDEKRRADRVFEWLRKQSDREPFLQDLREVVNREGQPQVIDTIPSPTPHRELPAGPVRQRETPKPLVGVPSFLQPLNVHMDDDTG